MPELPEVETIRRGLAQELNGAVIARFEVQDTRLLKSAAAKRMHERLAGRRLTDFQRVGKYLALVLDSGDRFVVHLRMTGQLLVSRSLSFDDKKIKTRFTLSFSDGRTLSFVDQRRFGEVWLLGPRDPWPSREPLGPDALEMTLAHFAQSLRQKKSPIQAALLDQTVIAGVGNIYAQEALFLSKIRPSRKAHRLSAAQAAALHDALLVILKNAITARGSTSRNYRDVYGEEGAAQLAHAVYQKTGEPCPRCRTLLRGIRIGGRGTVFCPGCQV